jgi:hypothetical protein
VLSIIYKYINVSVWFERKEMQTKYRKRERNNKEINESSIYGKERKNKRRKENKEYK